MTTKAIFDSKNILVIGGSGFVGSHLCEELVKSHKVICVDNFLTGPEDNIAHLLENPNFKLIKHDIIERLDLEIQPELAEFKVAFQGIQKIYFVASPTSPRDYLEHPVETMLVNSVGLRNALDLAVRYKSQFVYTSSPAVYGAYQSDEPISEQYVGPIDQFNDRACYSVSQHFGEGLVDIYRRIYEIDTKIVRIFNAYGPRMRLDDGRMIPEMIRAASENQDVVIYGSPESQGSYFYITDLVKALIKITTVNETGPINLGSEWETPFSVIAEKIIELAGSSSKIVYHQPDDLVARQIRADIGLAKDKLGWFPVILLEEGLEATIKHLSAQGHILRPTS